MYLKLSTFALIIPFVVALRLNAPENPTSGGPTILTWVNEAGDPPTFSFELVNQAFHNSFAIANNVSPGSGNLAVTLPIVPVGAGYTLEAVNVTDINQVFATSPPFSVGATPSTSASSLSTSSGSSAAGTASVPPPLTSSVFGTTVSTAPTATTPVGASGSSSGTSTAPTASFSSFNSAPRLSLNLNGGGFVVMLLSAIAGAAVVM